MRRNKHALIVGHPNPDSFTMAVARVYQEEATRLGHETVVRDLYRTSFQPCLQASEIPKPAGFEPDADVVAERALIADATVFAFFYPLWFYVPPAIITGYVQRVFGMGFGYGPQQHGENQRLLLGRSMISFSSSGSPAEWFRTEGGWDALRNLFDDHVAGVCGLTMLDHRHFGRMQSTTPASQVEAHFRDVRQTVARHFGDRAQPPQ